MKKLFAILLAVTMLASMATVVSAAENTTTLTTTVPAATYTLNIPADQEIPFGATSTEIGNVTVTNSSGFANGKNLQVTITCSDFVCPDVSTKIPFHFFAETTNTNLYQHMYSGDVVTFNGLSSGKVQENFQISNYQGGYDVTRLLLVIHSEDWGKALAGEYTATITFTAEVVAE